MTHKLNMYQQCHTISAKAKHAALVLSDACLVLCNELQQMWRQKKESDQGTRKHVLCGGAERS